MNDDVTCQTCGTELDPETDEWWGVQDSHALYSGYDLYTGTDEDRSGLICHGCERDFLGERGDTFVVVYPEYPDDPEAGGITKHRATVWQGILTDDGARIPDGPEPIDPDGPVFDLIRAYVLEHDLPAEWTRQFVGVPDDAEEWRQVGTGWHSSMERSDVSDKVNALTAGKQAVYGPVLVKFGETRNVCSISMTIWAAAGVAERVEDYLRGEVSAPGGAFKVR